MKPTCPVCNSQQSQVLHKLSQGNLVCCHGCKVVFYTPMPTLEELTAYYDSITYREEYASYEMTGRDFSQARYQQLLTQLNQPKFETQLSAKFEGKSRKLLDVGCGTGDFLQVASQHGWQFEGVEISEKAAQAAIAELNSPVRIGEVMTIDFQSEKYDLITSYHVMEYLLDLKALWQEA